MELYWYLVVIIFIVVKIFIYICWYRSRQRQMADFLSNSHNAQIVIVGGQAYLQQVYEGQNTSMWPGWRSDQEDISTSDPTGPIPPAPPYTQMDAPPPYDAISGGPWSNPATEIPLSRVTDAPPPYKPHPLMGEGPWGTGSQS